ncbi:MAG: putative ABC transport system ATP-binding protein [Planctomycetota bacterium]|jgi:putative ABC transport system ATP-binding protein
MSTQPQEPQIQCIDVGHSLRSGDQDLQILKNINLSIHGGEFVTIVGPSGSGKSTLLGLLAGLERPSTGSIRFYEQKIEESSEDQLSLWRRNKVGFVFQNFQLLGNLTARENVLLPLELSRVENPLERADEVLAQVGLSKRGHHYPSQLSGGEQQRVALARAFGHRPEVLFADEPTGNLDRESGELALKHLLQLRHELGTTLVLITHDQEVAQRGERTLHLIGGELQG